MQEVIGFDESITTRIGKKLPKRKEKPQFAVTSLSRLLGLVDFRISSGQQAAHLAVQSFIFDSKNQI